MNWSFCLHQIQHTAEHNSSSHRSLFEIKTFIYLFSYNSLQHSTRAIVHTSSNLTIKDSLAKADSDVTYQTFHTLITIIFEASSTLRTNSVIGMGFFLRVNGVWGDEKTDDEHNFTRKIKVPIWWARLRRHRIIVIEWEILGFSKNFPHNYRTARYSPTLTTTSNEFS